MSIGWFSCEIPPPPPTNNNRKQQLMQFSEEWKRLWAISSVFSPPLLIPHTSSSSTTSKNSQQHPKMQNPKIGPLSFNPSPETLVQLFSCPSYLSPRLPPPYPNLTLPRFLVTTLSPLLPSTASFIAANENISSSSHYTNSNDYNSTKFNNCLQLLRCPQSAAMFAFFPAGENLGEIGFLVLSVKDSKFEVKHNYGKPFLVQDTATHNRISRLLVNPVEVDFDNFNDSSEGDSSLSTSNLVTIGYMLACRDYSVYWYSIKTSSNSELSSCPRVDCVGSKWFRNSAVVYSCWSPHCVEESIVLLENGDLFLFDIATCSKNKKLEGKRLQISWDTIGGADVRLQGCDGWLSCEFSWHPRIMVVAHSNAVFSIDMRSGASKLSCLLKIENVSSGKSDKFIALSKAGSDGFRFAAVSKHSLLLCDVRYPMMPLLRWEHNLNNPNYVNVWILSELRSNSKEDMYKGASESGYCIFLGSFWDCEFSLFCYGPENRRGFGLSKMSKDCNSFSAWGLPSEISLSGRGCYCGTCLVKEEFSKQALHRWIDWRQKKDLVMGFGIVDQDISSQLCEPDSYGGFYLVRLMSSGKLELQRYCAAWELDHISEVAHDEPVLDSKDNLLYDLGEAKYELPKKYRFLVLDNLRECLKGRLSRPTIYSCPDVYEDHAVNLGDDTDDLSHGAKRMRHSPSQEPEDHDLAGGNLGCRNHISEKKTYMPFSQKPTPNDSNQPVGPKMFDEGCPLNLRFDDIDMEFGPKELKMYNMLRSQDLKFQKEFKLNQENSDKI